MTVEGLAASLAWSAVAGYAAWRADMVVIRFLADRAKQQERDGDLNERVRIETVVERIEAIREAGRLAERSGQLRQQEINLDARRVALDEEKEKNRAWELEEAREAAERLAMTQAERDRLAKLANRPAASLDLPDDLEAVALQESEEWARDNERTLMRQRFTELFTGDDAETWQKVRSAVGIAEMP